MKCKVASLLPDTVLGVLVNPKKREFVNSINRVLVDTTTNSRIPELHELNLFKYHSHTTIPTGNHNPVFSQICDARACDILEQSKHEQVTIGWSGGIDSTLVLVSLLKNGFNKQQHKINVTLTRKSIEEYSYFFYNHIIKYFDVVSWNQYAPLENVLYTGECADQLFGSDIMLAAMRMYGDDISTQDYGVLTKFFEEKWGKAGLNVYQHYLPIVDFAPWKIKTVHDFLWWWNFSQKWDYARQRILCWVGVDSLSKSDNLRTFYNTEDFQLWSINEHHQKMPNNTQLDYKFPSKEYIIDYTKDERFWGKTKMPSFSNRNGGAKTLIIDEHNQPSNYQLHLNTNFI